MVVLAQTPTISRRRHASKYVVRGMHHIASMIVLLLTAWNGWGITYGDEIIIDPVGIRAIDTVDVPTEHAGALMELHVATGDHVKSGDALMNLDDREAQLELQRALIDLQQAKEIADSDVKIRSAESSVALAKLDLRRAEESISRYAKSVTQSQLDRLQALLTRAELELELANFESSQQRLSVLRAQNAVDVAERSLESRRIRAPIDGQIVAINLGKGEWLEPGDAVARIVDTTRLRAEGFIAPVPNIARLIGSPAQLSVGGDHGEPLRVDGRVSFVSPEINRVDGKVRIWVDIDNPTGQLLPGATGRLKLVLPEPSVE